MHAGTSLEFPELLAVRRIKSHQSAVVATDEKQPACRRERAAVALLGPLIPPRQLVGRDIERRDDPRPRHAREGRRAAEICDAVSRRHELRIATAGETV